MENDYYLEKMPTFFVIKAIPPQKSLKRCKNLLLICKRLLYNLSMMI